MNMAFSTLQILMGRRSGSWGRYRTAPSSLFFYNYDIFSIIWSTYGQLEGGEERATRPSLQGRRRFVLGTRNRRDRLGREGGNQGTRATASQERGFALWNWCWKGCVTLAHDGLTKLYDHDLR